MDDGLLVAGINWRRLTYTRRRRWGTNHRHEMQRGGAREVHSRNVSIGTMCKLGFRSSGSVRQRILLLLLSKCPVACGKDPKSERGGQSLA